MIIVFFLTILLVSFTFFPQNLLLAENVIIITQLGLGYRIKLEVIKIFAFVLSAIYILEIYEYTDPIGLMKVFVIILIIEIIKTMGKTVIFLFKNQG